MGLGADGQRAVKAQQSAEPAVTATKAKGAEGGGESG